MDLLLPSMSTTEFIQNDNSHSTPVVLPRVVSNSSANLVSLLKQSLQQTQTELNQQIFLNSELKIYKSKYEDLNNDYNVLATNYESLESEKKFSDIEIANLRKETEELSSQLFSEANNMVSQARKEAFNYKKINDALKNEISEKDNLVHILKSQLSDLKTMLQNQDDIDYQNASQQQQQPQQPSRPHSGPLSDNIEITVYPDNSLSNGDSLIENNNNNLQHDIKIQHARNASNGNLSITNHNSTPKTSSAALSLNNNNNNNTSNLIYAPTVQALRYDIKTYQMFTEFGEQLYHEFKSGRHTSNNSKASYLEIKEYKFFKKLMNDDIDPTLRLDEAPGVAFYTKKNLINSMLIGKVSIEPISSVNESYKTDIVLNSLSDLSMNGGSKNSNSGSPKVGNQTSLNEPPVAFEDPCSLCGEIRNDTLDHTRLYVLKVIGTKTVKKKKDQSTNNLAFSKYISNNSSGNTVTITQEYIANQYPLCSYCLHRVRSVCELFAFLRGIKAGIWKFDTKINCQKNWIECVRIRTKVFYSRIGIIESTHNLINNNSFTFNVNQINGIEGNHYEAHSNRNSGYFSNYGTRLSSPVMTNFAAFGTNNNNSNNSTINGGHNNNSGSVSLGNDSESETGSIKNNGIFSNRSSLINSFWGANNNSASSTNTTTGDAAATGPTDSPKSGHKKKGSDLLAYNESSSSFNSEKLEGKIDEAMSSSANVLVTEEPSLNGDEIAGAEDDKHVDASKKIPVEIKAGEVADSTKSELKSAEKVIELKSHSSVEKVANEGEEELEEKADETISIELEAKNKDNEAVVEEPKGISENLAKLDNLEQNDEVKLDREAEKVKKTELEHDLTSRKVSGVESVLLTLDPGPIIRQHHLESTSSLNSDAFVDADHGIADAGFK